MTEKKRPTGGVSRGNRRSINTWTESTSGMRPIQALIDRLDGVRETSHGQYMARCSAHEDRSASLAVRETSDGTVLLHCFAGCSANDILTAVGLELADLFPDRGEYTRRAVPGARWDWRGLLLTLRAESTVVLLAAEAIRRGESLSAEGTERLVSAIRRITQVANLAEARA